MSITLSDIHIEQVEGTRWRVLRPADGAQVEFEVDPAAASGRDTLGALEQAARDALAEADG